MEGDVDPQSILLAIGGLSANITDVGSALSNQRGDTASHAQDEEDDTLDAHTQVIARLQAVIYDLREVTLACANHSKHGSSMESPLDPMLYDWISDCALILLGIKELVPTADGNSSHDPTETEDDLDGEWTLVSPVRELGDVDETREQADENNTKRAEECKRKEALGELLEKLKEHTMHLEDFIPIMRADLNEALATNVSRTQLPHEAPPRAPRKEGNFSAPSTHHAQNSLESLRAHLYDLSDELKSSQELLERLLDIRALPGETKTEVSLLKKTQATTVTTLAELLSNNSSEWIESMLAGKLSFSEFSALDQEEIEEFCAGLKIRNAELRRFAGMRGRVRGRGRAVEDAIDEEDLGAAEVRWWREGAEGLNWTLKARTRV